MNGPMLVGLLLAVAALLYVLAPLVWPRAFDVETPGARADGAAAGGAERSLEWLRDDLFARIVELDFDHQVGKSDEEEYRQERAALKRQALTVLCLLDERAAAAATEDEIEREVRRARARRVTAPDDGDRDAVPWLEDEVEREVRALRRARPATPAAGAREALPSVGGGRARAPRSR